MSAVIAVHMGASLGKPPKTAASQSNPPNKSGGMDPRGQQTHTNVAHYVGRIAMSARVSPRLIRQSRDRLNGIMTRPLGRPSGAAQTPSGARTWTKLRAAPTSRKP